MATGPRPRSSSASTTVPTAGRSGLALGSTVASEVRRIVSSRSSMPWPGLGADGHERHVAAVLLDDDAALGELRLDAVRLAVGQVDLVERHDDGHARGPGMVDGLDRLGHDAVIGGDHQHRDVGDPGAARAHRGEGLVARRVEEDDAPAVVDDLAGADALGDAAPLALRHGGAADAVEKAGLAMVDMTHDRDDGRSLAELVRACPPRTGSPSWPVLVRPRPRRPAPRTGAPRKPGSPAPRSRGPRCHGRWSG